MITDLKTIYRNPIYHAKAKRCVGLGMAVGLLLLCLSCTIAPMLVR